MRIGCEGLWIHVACVIYCVEGPYFALAARLQRPVLIKRYLGLHARHGFACSICRGTHGFSLRCGFPNCHQRVHVPCAFAADLRPKLELVPSPRRGPSGGRLVKVVACAAHASPAARAQIMRHRAHLMDIAEEIDAEWPPRPTSTSSGSRVHHHTKRHHAHGAESTSGNSTTNPWGLSDSRPPTAAGLRVPSSVAASAARRRWGTPSPPVSQDAAAGKDSSDSRWKQQHQRDVTTTQSTATSRAGSLSKSASDGRHHTTSHRLSAPYLGSSPLRLKLQHHQQKGIQQKGGRPLVPWGPPVARGDNKLDRSKPAGGWRPSKQAASRDRTLRSSSQLLDDDDEEEELYIEEEEEDEDEEDLNNRSTVSATARQQQRSKRASTAVRDHSKSDAGGPYAGLPRRSRTARRTTTASDAEDRGTSSHVGAASHVIQRGVRLKWERYETLFKRRQFLTRPAAAPTKTQSSSLSDLDAIPIPMDNASGEPSIHALVPFLTAQTPLSHSPSTSEPPLDREISTLFNLTRDPARGDATQFAVVLLLAAGKNHPPEAPTQQQPSPTAAAGGAGKGTTLSPLRDDPAVCSSSSSSSSSNSDAAAAAAAALLSVWSVDRPNSDDGEQKRMCHRSSDIRRALQTLREGIASIWPGVPRCPDGSTSTTVLSENEDGNVWDVPQFMSLWDTITADCPDFPHAFQLGVWLSQIRPKHHHPRRPSCPEADTAQKDLSTPIQQHQQLLLQSHDDGRDATLDRKRRRCIEEELGASGDGDDINSDVMTGAQQFLVPVQKARRAAMMGRAPLSVSRLVAAVTVLESLLRVHQGHYVRLTPYQVALITRRRLKKELPPTAEEDGDPNTRNALSSVILAEASAPAIAITADYDKFMSLWSALQEVPPHHGSCNSVVSATASTVSDPTAASVLTRLGSKGPLPQTGLRLSTPLTSHSGGGTTESLPFGPFLKLSTRRRLVESPTAMVRLPECELAVTLASSEDDASASATGVDHIAPLLPPAIPGPTLPVLGGGPMGGGASSRPSAEGDGPTPTTNAVLDKKRHAAVGGFVWDMHLGRELQLFPSRDTNTNFVPMQTAFFTALFQHVVKKLDASKRTYVEAVLADEELPTRVPDVPTVLASVNSLYLMAAHWGRVSSHLVWGCADQPDSEFFCSQDPKSGFLSFSSSFGILPSPLCYHFRDPDSALLRPALGPADIMDIAPTFAVSPGRTKACSVCFGGEWDSGNPVVTCSRCCASMHRGCYAIGEPVGEEDSDPYYCLRCVFEKKRPAPGHQGFLPGSLRCVLCNTLGGALKRTTTGRWVHVSCALFLLPEVVPRDIKSLDNWDTTNISPWRFDASCSVCRVEDDDDTNNFLCDPSSPAAGTNSDDKKTELERATTAAAAGGSEAATVSHQRRAPCYFDSFPQRLTEAPPHVPVSRCVSVPRGACLRCSYPGCDQTFHPMCAWLSGMYVEVTKATDTFYDWVTGTDRLYFPQIRVVVFCFHHAPDRAFGPASFPPIHRLSPERRSTAYQRCLRLRRYVNRDLYPHLFPSLTASDPKKLAQSKAAAAAAMTVPSSSERRLVAAAAPGAPLRGARPPPSDGSKTKDEEPAVAVPAHVSVPWGYGPDPPEELGTTDISRRLLAKLSVPLPSELISFPDKNCDQYCAVCLCHTPSGRTTTETELLARCRRCGLAVHRSCYGVLNARRSQLRRRLGLQATDDVSPPAADSTSTTCGGVTTGDHTTTTTSDNDDDDEGTSGGIDDGWLLFETTQRRSLTTTTTETSDDHQQSTPLRRHTDETILHHSDGGHQRDDAADGPTEVDTGGGFTCDICSTAKPVDDAACMLCPRRGGPLKTAVLYLDWTPLTEATGIVASADHVDVVGGKKESLSDDQKKAARPTAVAHVHVVCALFCPGVTVGSSDGLHPILGLERVLLSQFYGTNTCSICNLTRGVCLPCSWSGCRKAHHPLCAQLKGLILEQRLDGDKITILTYCEMHTTQQQQKQQQGDTCRPATALMVLDKLRAILEESRVVARELYRRVKDKATETGHLMDLLHLQQPLIGCMDARYGARLPGRPLTCDGAYASAFVPVVPDEKGGWRIARTEAVSTHLEAFIKRPLGGAFKDHQRAPRRRLMWMTSRYPSGAALGGGGTGGGGTPDLLMIQGPQQQQQVQSEQHEDMDQQHQHHGSSGGTTAAAAKRNRREDMSHVPAFTSMCAEELIAAAHVRDLTPAELIDVARLSLPEYHRRRRGRPSAKERLVRLLVLGAARHAKATDLPETIVAMPFFKEALACAEQCGRSLQGILCSTAFCGYPVATTTGSSTATTAPLRRGASKNRPAAEQLEHDQDESISSSAGLGDDRLVEVELSEQQSDTTTVNNDDAAGAGGGHGSGDLWDVPTLLSCADEEEEETVITLPTDPPIGEEETIPTSPSAEPTMEGDPSSRPDTKQTWSAVEDTGPPKTEEEEEQDETVPGGDATTDATTANDDTIGREEERAPQSGDNDAAGPPVAPCAADDAEKEDHDGICPEGGPDVVVVAAAHGDAQAMVTVTAASCSGATPGGEEDDSTDVILPADDSCGTAAAAAAVAAMITPPVIDGSSPEVSPDPTGDAEKADLVETEGHHGVVSLLSDEDTPGNTTAARPLEPSSETAEPDTPSSPAPAPADEPEDPPVQHVTRRETRKSRQARRRDPESNVPNSKPHDNDDDNDEPPPPTRRLTGTRRSTGGSVARPTSHVVYDSILGLCRPTFPFPNCPWYSAIPDSAPPLPAPLRRLGETPPAPAPRPASLKKDVPTDDVSTWRLPLLRTDGPVGEEAVRVIDAVGLLTHVPITRPRFTSGTSSAPVRQVELCCRLLRALNQFRTACDAHDLPLLTLPFLEPSNRDLFSRAYSETLAAEFVSLDGLHAAFTQKLQRPADLDLLGQNVEEDVSLWDCYAHFALPSTKTPRRAETSWTPHTADAVFSAMKAMFHRLVDQSMSIVSEIERLGPIAHWDTRHPDWDGLLWMDVLSVGQEIRMFDVTSLSWRHGLVVAFDASRSANAQPSSSSSCWNRAALPAGTSTRGEEGALGHRYLLFFFDTPALLDDTVPALESKNGTFEWRDIRTREVVQFRSGNPCWLPFLLHLDADVHIRSFLFVESHLGAPRSAILKCSGCLQELGESSAYLVCRRIVREARVMPTLPTAIPTGTPARRRSSTKASANHASSTATAAPAAMEEEDASVAPMPLRLTLCAHCYCKDCIISCTRRSSVAHGENLDDNVTSTWETAIASASWACPRCTGLHAISAVSEEKIALAGDTTEEDNSQQGSSLRRKRRPAGGAQIDGGGRTSKRKRRSERHK